MRVQLSVKENQRDNFVKEYSKLDNADYLDIVSGHIDPLHRDRIIFTIDYDKFNKLKHNITGYRLVNALI